MDTRSNSPVHVCCQGCGRIFTATTSQSKITSSSLSKHLNKSVLCKSTYDHIALVRGDSFQKEKRRAAVDFTSSVIRAKSQKRSRHSQPYPITNPNKSTEEDEHNFPLQLSSDQEEDEANLNLNPLQRNEQFRRTPYPNSDQPVELPPIRHDLLDNTVYHSCLTHDITSTADSESSEEDSELDDDRDSQVISNTPVQQPAQSSTDSTSSFQLVRRQENWNSRIHLKPTSQMHAELSLLQLISRMKMPLGSFREIQLWAQQAAMKNHDFSQPFRTRQVVIGELRHQFDHPSNEFKPHQLLWLPEERTVTVYIRSFEDALYSLLHNTDVNNDQSLSFPDEFNPFLFSNTQRSSEISELHHGKWWRRTCRQLCQPNSSDILVPIILYMDGISTDHNGNLQVTPLNMTLGIFNTKTRTNPEAWTTLYYHPTNDTESVYHSATTKPVHNIQNLHRGLQAALKSFKKVCDRGGMKWKSLSYAGKKWDVTMQFALCFVIGDTEMHDQLCGHFGCRNDKISMICRHCTCPTSELVNPQYQSEVQLFLPHMVQPTSTVEDLKKVSHHPIENCFHDLEFGSNKNNIHFATPGELLHMHQKGALVRAVESLHYILNGGVEDACSKKKKVSLTVTVIDNLAFRYGVLIHRKADRKFPRTKFKNSLFNKTKKAAHEQSGVCLDLLLAMLSDRGREVLISDRTLDERNLEDQVYVFELIIAFESWLKKHTFSRKEIQGLKEGLDHYVETVAQSCQRTGMGSKLIKNHLVFHIPKYIEMWGPPRGWDSGPSESHHKTEVKAPSKNTQRHKATFLKQVALRYDELLVVRTAAREWGMSQKSVFGSSTNLQRQGSKFSIGRDENGFPTMRWDDYSAWNRTSTFPKDILEFCCNEICPLLSYLPDAEQCVSGFTEHIRTDGTETYIFRAHPSYKSSDESKPSVWYDWAEVFFDDDLYLPCQLLCLLHLENLIVPDASINGVNLDGPGKYAVVRCFKDPPADIRQSHFDGVRYSSIVQWGTLEELFYLISVDSIVRPLTVVPNVPVSSSAVNLHHAVDPKGGYFVVSNQDEWAEVFSQLLVHET